MKSYDDLAQALLEEGIDPSEAQIEHLDAEITQLAEILLDFHLFVKGKSSKKDGNFDSPSVSG